MCGNADFQAPGIVRALSSLFCALLSKKLSEINWWGVIHVGNRNNFAVSEQHAEKPSETTQGAKGLIKFAMNSYLDFVTAVAP